MSAKELLTAFEKIPTPFYYYNLDILRQTLKKVVSASERFGYHVHYALKANADERILEIIRDAGLGADCVSGNEILKAVETGFSPGDIFFAGVGKTDREIRIGLDNNIGCFNVESFEELQVIEQIAAGQEKYVPVAIRLNPGVDGHTHRYITTGTKLNKFGILPGDLGPVIALLKKSAFLHFRGIHVHIGSQIMLMDVYRQLCLRVNHMQNIFRSQGLDVPLINLGGGLGVDYDHPEKNPIPDFEQFFSVVHDTLEVSPGQEVYFEPGRSVVAQMGALITRVLFVKQSGERKFIIVDAGMTDLIRPALYDTSHRIENLSLGKTGKRAYWEPVDIVGPVCETADTFARDLKFPASQRGNVLAICSTGAYGRMMASEYNLRDKAGIVYSDDIQSADVKSGLHDRQPGILYHA